MVDSKLFSRISLRSWLLYGRLYGYFILAPLGIMCLALEGTGRVLLNLTARVGEMFTKLRIFV